MVVALQQKIADMGREERMKKATASIKELMKLSKSKSLAAQVGRGDIYKGLNNNLHAIMSYKRRRA
eukprot:3099344-Amphidinium_carterae.2